MALSQCQGIAYPLEDIAGGDTLITQFFGQRIHSAQPSGSGRGFRRVDFGMGHAPPSVELAGFSVEDIFGPGVVGGLEMSDAFEPYDFHCGRAIGEKSDQAHLRPLAVLGETDESSFYLQIGHLISERADSVGLRAVDIVGGKIMDQVVKRAYAEFVL